ncbi:hypothetical protein [Cryptosporangium minutisporangium]|uniref:Uncharacterized protein n=1 Tax=Cryptosporangium minutisporangium TaxID=113569 RepID=A0ABP6T5Q8_9ACTN
MHDRPIDPVGMPGGGDVLNPARAFAALGRTPVTEPPLGETLQTITLFTHQTIAAAAEVSITVIAQDQTTTVAHTGTRALALDEGQYRAG